MPRTIERTVSSRGARACTRAARIPRGGVAGRPPGRLVGRAPAGPEPAVRPLERGAAVGDGTRTGRFAAGGFEADGSEADCFEVDGIWADGFEADDFDVPCAAAGGFAPCCLDAGCVEEGCAEEVCIEEG
ncbi:hypothetical protein [Cellulomonas composti]|uniref:Uncharacterized protein n=1 Tax=Cellulomonas composti TaxID=266130 RepID=A0A511JAC5_9CELL|nr:hypothetical protein [Cellulomonas composti]GEL94940.1 hypothetical protein CCO02nite_15980 [Cellulomonas composti]